MALLAAAGVEVREETVSVADLMAADEVFSTGNFGKVLPITRIDDRSLQPGPVFAQAHALYFDYAKTAAV